MPCIYFIAPIASSSHVISSNVHVSEDSPHSPPSQVVFEQENARLKEILANGIHKCHKGSEKFNDILSKQKQIFFAKKVLALFINISLTVIHGIGAIPRDTICDTKWKV
jgi:hypothetical protein